MEVPPLPEEKVWQIMSDTEAVGKTEEDPGSTGNRTQKPHNFRQEPEGYFRRFSALVENCRARILFQMSCTDK